MNHVFLAKVNLLRSMLKWIVKCIEPMHLDAAIVQKIELASEEAIVNIICHSYQNRPEKIEIDVKTVPKHSVEIAVKDYGPPFDPLQYKIPSCSTSLEERQEGGLGIHLMRQYMDEIRYRREGNANILTLVVFFK